jgi:hypothetical protein
MAPEAVLTLTTSVIQAIMVEEAAVVAFVAAGMVAGEAVEGAVEDGR